MIFFATNIIKDYKKSNFKLEISKVSLKPNSITGVVGENGNGKTTLLNIIAGQLSCKSDRFTYFDKTPKNTDDWVSVKDKIAFIPQRIPKWHGTLMQNLMLKATLENIPKSEIVNTINASLEFFGLTKFAHLKWSEISTGYRLKFELARVLIGDSQLLVLDEPIANLDINAQQQFLSDLKKIIYSKDYPIAIILSSQQLHEIETIADEMIFIKNGKAIFSGSTNTLENSLTSIELHVKDTVSLEKFLLSKKHKFIKKGVYYQVEIDKLSSNEFLSTLISNNIEISYYRNISNSTKKLF